MKLKNTFLILLLAVVSCKGKLVTNEQENRFNSCKVEAIEFYKKLPVKQMSQTEKDSAQMITNDLSELDLEQFIEKYNIKEKEIDGFIESLCLSSQMDAGLNEIDKKMEENHLQLDTSVKNALLNDSLKRTK